MTASIQQEPRDDRGRWTKAAGAKAAGLKALARKHKTLLTESAIAGTSMAASAVGGQLAGSVGATVGGVIGTMVARNLAHVAAVALTQHQREQHKAAFQKATVLQKIAKTAGKTLNELRRESVQEELGEKITGDLAFFGISTAVTAATSMVPAASGLIGMAAAFGLSGKVTAARNRHKGKA